MSQLNVHRPTDGSLITTVSQTSLDAVDEMFNRASSVQKKWSQLSPVERGASLRRVARQLETRASEIAEIDNAETGHGPKLSEAEVSRCVAALDYYAGLADKVGGSTIPLGYDRLAYTSREPYGVVVAITPWNVGLRLAVKKAAQSLAFGNVCIIKPSPETPLATLLLREVFDEAGIPDGAFQVAVGGGDLGSALVEHRLTGLVTFTGSTQVGRRIAAAAGENLVPAITELGGKSPQVVFADADISAAINGVVAGGFLYSGQMCVAGTRILVEDSIYDDFTDRLASATRAQVVGDPAEPDVTVGPQISAAQRDKTVEMIDAEKRSGTPVLAQASLPDDPSLSNGFYAPPTVFGDVALDSDLMRKEVFGPVLAVSRFSDEEEAVTLANDSEYGLAAGVWTKDGAKAARAARDIESGVVWINTYLELSDQIPFGGTKASGLYRQNGIDSYLSYTRVKSVVHAI